MGDGMTAVGQRRDLLRAARANIAAARATHALGNTGLASALLACAREQVLMAGAWPRSPRHVWGNVEVRP